MDDYSFPTGQTFEELKRISRILELVQMFAVAPHRYLRKDLAAHFGVSERMITKDLDIIKNGLKLRLRHSPEGYYFDDVPRLPALQYSFSEALALLLAVQAARQMPGIASSDLAAAVARLGSLFPPELAPLLMRSLSSPPASVRGRAAPSSDSEWGAHRQEMLALVNRALIEQRKLRIVYETRSRGGEIGERIIHPYAVLPYVRSWQLVAFCERRQEVLIFKVDRIHQADLLEERYRLPEDFVLDEYMGSAWGMMRGNAGEVVDVVLRFTEDAGHRVAEEYWHKSQQFEEQPDGCMVLRLQIAPTPEFVHWVLYYGSQVEVLEPEGVRRAVSAELSKMTSIYLQGVENDGRPTNPEGPLGQNQS
ncbi:MAG: WYL domain-containing protein [Chloroflexi bacterium]|nr:WYL domain-containing protein [Chloroflexota bacterium]